MVQKMDQIEVYKFQETGQFGSSVNLIRPVYTPCDNHVTCKDGGRLDGKTRGSSQPIRTIPSVLHHRSKSLTCTGEVESE